MVIRSLQQALAGGVEVVAHSLHQRRGGVETVDLPRAAQRVADVVVPDDLAVGGVEEGHPVAPKVERIVRYTS